MSVYIGIYTRGLTVGRTYKRNTVLVPSITNLRTIDDDTPFLTVNKSLRGTSGSIFFIIRYPLVLQLLIVSCVYVCCKADNF